MILLTSNGLSSDNLLNKLKFFCTGAEKKSVIVTTASVGYKEKDKHIPRLTKELQSLGLDVDFFDFDIQDPQNLLQYDVIEIIGGNPFYLLKSMRNANCKEVLRELSKTKIIIGISAGSLVLQKNISLVAQYSPEMNEGIDLLDLTGMELTNLKVLPHYNRFLHRFDKFEERAKAYELANKCEIIRINDGQGIFVKAEGYLVI